MAIERLLQALVLAGMAGAATGSVAEVPSRAHFAATISRTAEGVAHIAAHDMAGLGYGAGYSAAQDNGCVIADNLVTVSGERALYFGDGQVTVGFNAIPNLESDFFHRAIGDLPNLEREFAATSRDNRALLDGFAAGYNRYLRDHPEGFAAECRGSAWLRPIRREDMLLLVNDAAVQDSGAPYARFVAGAAPPLAGNVAAIPPNLELPDSARDAGLGSNGWAFGSRKTANGRGMLVGNPHFPWAGPNRLRRFHLTIPGTLDVMGAGPASSPYVAIGFNRDVAWTHTVATSQHLSVYRLELDRSDATVYRVDGRREAMTRHKITVALKGGGSASRVLYATRYGPAIAIPGSGLGWSRTTAYALRDANQGNLRMGDAWLGIARARSVRQVRDVVARTLGMPYVNTIAADRAGGAFFGDISAIPDLSIAKLIRCSLAQAGKPDADSPAFYILDGSVTACGWDVDSRSRVAGLMPASELPQTIGADYLQNSNDSYWLSDPHAPMAALSPVLGPWQTPQSLRTRSAIAVLDAEPGKIDMARARELALGNRVEAAVLVLDDLLALCPREPALQGACATLRAWDRRAELDSRGALLFFAFWRRASTIKNIWAVPFDAGSPITTPRGLAGAQSKPILDALKGAVAELAELKIPLDAPLGQFQLSPHGTERIAIHGGPDRAGVLNAIDSTSAPTVLTPYHGSSYIQVVTFDDHGPIADSLLSYSQSSNPDSPYSADGTRAYSAKRWLRLPFTAAEVAAQRVGDVLAISE